MKDLIEALEIFSKYTTSLYNTQCEHDELYVCISPEIVSPEDKTKLEDLGFRPRDDSFVSFRHGSC